MRLTSTDSVKNIFVDNNLCPMINNTIPCTAQICTPLSKGTVFKSKIVSHKKEQAHGHGQK